MGADLINGADGGRPRPQQGRRDARKGNDRPRPARQACRKVPDDSGGRIRPGGDAPRPRGEARCAVEQAGHRHRPVEGSACRRKGPARTTRVSRGVEAASVEHRRNEAHAEAALGTSLGCHQACPSERGTLGCIAPGALAARSYRRSCPHGCATICVCEEGRAHQGCEGQKGCGPEGCQDPRPPFLTTNRDDARPRATGSIGSI